VTVSLTLTRVDGLSATYAAVPILAAPTPEIVSMVPSTIFLDADNPTFSLAGNHFRTPDKEGKFASIVGIGQYSAVGGGPGADLAFPISRSSFLIPHSAFRIQQLGDSGVYETFTTTAGIRSISRSEIVIDPLPILRRLAAGFVIVQVTNPYSGLVSEPFRVDVREGAGEPTIDRVLIDFVHRPSIQSDEEQTLIISGESFSQIQMTLSIGGVAIVSEGLVVDETRTQLFIEPKSITVVAEPGVLTATGTVPVRLEIAGQVATSSYEVRDPLPPVLARVEPTAVDNSRDEFITVTGDNFRGKGGEEPTLIELVPASQSGEILPDGQPYSLEVSSLENVVIDPAEGADDAIERLLIPKDALQIPSGQTHYYRIRATNPYSSLSTIEPRMGSVVTDLLLAVTGGTPHKR
jgi:hypothetical protein